MRATGSSRSRVCAQRRVGEDLARLAEVRLDERRGAGRVAGHQRPRVREHDRVIVHVDDPGVRRRCLRDLVGVARGGDSGADVEELPDTRLPGQVADGAAEEGAVLAGLDRRRRDRGDEPVSDLPVGPEVVLSAQQVVVDPGGMRHAGIDLGRQPVRIFRGSENSLIRTAVLGHQRLLGGVVEHAIAAAAGRCRPGGLDLLRGRNGEQSHSLASMN